MKTRVSRFVPTGGSVSRRIGHPVFSLLLCALLAGCARTEPATAPNSPRPVHTVEARRSVADVERHFSGVVRAASLKRLSFQVPGRLVGRPIEIGSRVASGDLLARLDPTDFRLRVERAEAALGRARAQARRAADDFERVRRLYADDNATRSDLDASTAALEVTRGSVVEAERVFELARRELTYTRYSAAKALRVVDLFAETGENLAAGEPFAAVVEVDSALELEWEVPESAIGRIRPGLEVEADLPALGLALSATVIEVGAAARRATSTFPVFARVEIPPNADSPLPGMAAEIRVRLAAPGVGNRGPLLLPPEAVSGDPEGAFVFVVEVGEGRARSVRRQPVELGALRPEGLEVVSGLMAGETVVAAGVSFLEDGQPVEPLRGDPLAELPSASPSTPDPAAGATP